MRQSALTLVALAATGAWSLTEDSGAEKMSVRIGRFGQEVSQQFDESDELPSEAVNWIVATEGDGGVTAIAGTEKGMALIVGDSVMNVEEHPTLRELPKSSELFKTEKGEVFAIADSKIYREEGRLEFKKMNVELPHGLDVNCVAKAEAIYLGTNKGLFVLDDDAFAPVAELNDLMGGNKTVFAVASGPKIAVAAKSGLYCSADASGKDWERIFPSNAGHSWAPVDVRGAAWDAKGRLWFASPHGVGCRETDGSWSLYTGEEGVPYDDFTCMVTGPDCVWFGTSKGAVCFDGQHWAYRHGKRWLPGEHVRAISVASNGDAWFATSKGVGLIARKPMTLAEKAKFFEDEIDKYNRRTEYGYVIEAELKRAGIKSTAKTRDSDNDGLWTSMYGAGECFAYAATKDPMAKKRAKDAFEALRFLMMVTQGGAPPALPGFVARSILPTDGEDPNEFHYTKEKDLQQKQHDALWKVMAPRWPKSADGKWYWKCDTSSDELDGHYFFYAAYYDLVAESEEEKARVREVVKLLTDHLCDHDFCLVDWDGQPTRWAIYGPDYLNNNPAFFGERGLNSLSILSYLSAALHVTGDERYRQAFDMLVNDHGYAQNITVPKNQNGPGSGNQSDDEMAFMSFYNLMKYCPNKLVKSMCAFSFNGYWVLEEPEMNPFFNFAYAGVSEGATFQDQYDVLDLAPKGPWLEQSLDTLKRFPLDRISWSYENSHRKDLVPLPPHRRAPDEHGKKGHRRNGLVIPVDETYFNHWNYDPWNYDEHMKGRCLGDGAVFLLPYYMGLSHGFIVEEK